MPSDLTVRIWTRLARAQRDVLGTIEAALKAAGLPPLGWYDVLLEIDRAGTSGIRPFELERVTLLAQHNLSRLLDRLVRAGYAERNPAPQDGRGHALTITPSGSDVRRKMWPVYVAAIQAALGDRLAPHEAAALDLLLARLVRCSTEAGD